MRSSRFVAIGVACSLLGTACAAFQIPQGTLAPGADQVKMTEDLRDVTWCEIAGNVKLAPDRPSANQFHNQVLGLHGNVGLVTLGGLKYPTEGIAYRCPQ